MWERATRSNLDRNVSFAAKGCLIIHKVQIKAKAAASQRDAMLVEQSNLNPSAPR